MFFDNTTKGAAKILAKLGGKGYDLLILLNSMINAGLKMLGKNKVSFSKRVKNSVKKAVAYINKFETTIAELAIEKNYDYVICGHIHQPCIKEIATNTGKVQYLNSGDWVENLTALEYNNGNWELFQYNSNDFAEQTIERALKKAPEANIEADIFKYLHYSQSINHKGL
jgi:Uncharacterized protein conserved in bacteria